MSTEMLIGIANDVREALSRIMRLESQAAVASMNNVHCFNTVQSIHSEVCALQSQVQVLQSTVNSSSGGDLTKTSQLTSSSDDSIFTQTLTATDYCAFSSCKELLSQNNRPCSAAVCLRHMMCCAGCPSDVCRVLFILNHMSNFVRAPQVSQLLPFLTAFSLTQQVCHGDTCCYCGMNMASLSPDDRSKHRKLCIIVSYILVLHISVHV